MDHTVLPAIRGLHQCLPLPCKRSTDGASPHRGCGHLIAVYYSFIYPERIKGWVGLDDWPTADGLPTSVVTRRLEVERRTRTVHRSKTNVLPLPRNQPLTHTPNWPVALSLLLLHQPGTLYPLTFDCAKAFSLSNATCSDLKALYKCVIIIIIIIIIIIKRLTLR